MTKGNNAGGLLLLQKPLLRSPYFLISSTLGVLCLAFNIYLAHAHWRALWDTGIVRYSVPVGLQLVYLWWRALRYYARIESLCAEYPVENAGQAEFRRTLLATVSGALSDLLFWSFAIAFMMLLYLNHVFTT